MEQLDRQPAEVNFMQPPEQREQLPPAPISKLFYESHPRSGSEYVSDSGFVVEFKRRVLGQPVFDYGKQQRCRIDVLNLAYVPPEFKDLLAKHYDYLHLGVVFTGLVYENEKFIPLQAGGMVQDQVVNLYKGRFELDSLRPRSAHQSRQRRTLVA